LLANVMKRSKAIIKTVKQFDFVIFLTDLMLIEINKPQVGMTISKSMAFEAVHNESYQTRKILKF
jgi:ribonucleotide reductase beta subunit family protein with ferritin-like domain